MNHITKEHILQAIQEIDQEGSRPGRHSSTYDLLFKDKLYPPKLVISIANRFATGIELKPEEFQGGPNKPAFNTLEKFGFIIVPKKSNLSLYQLKESFLQEWPLSRVQTMILEEYTNLDKTSFCYWMEALTADLGSIWGGSAYKFGVYKRKDTSTIITVDNRITDGDYAWFQKYGATKDEAFQTIKHTLLTIIKNAQNDQLEAIDSIDLGDAYKWKIAFLYGNYNVVNIFKHESLLEAAQSLGYIEKNENYSALNRFILSKKSGPTDYFEFTGELWKQTSLANPKKYWLYAPGENATKWEEFYSEGIMGLGWDALGDLDNYKSKNEIKAKLQELEDVTSTKQNDTAANYEFHKAIKPGDVVIVKKGISELLGYGIVTSDYFYDENKDSYQKCRKVDWKLKGSWKVDFNLVQKTLTDITKYKTEDSNYSKYYERLLGIMEGEVTTKNSNMTDSTKLSLNQILYGPPGTGKTYTLQNEYFDQFTLKETTVTREQYLEQVVSELNWWQVISIAVLDLGVAKVNSIHEHEFVKIKEALSSSKTVRPTIWGQLQRHTVLDCPFVNVSDRSEPLYFTKNEDSEWTIDHALLQEYYPEAFSLLDSSKNYHPAIGAVIKNYEFITFHQSFSYEDFLEGIKPKMDDGDQDLAYEIQDGIFKRLCLKAEADPTNKYALFIDEINRGNVSAIFGELITLIEEDKRLGAANALRAKLPYSKMSFGVPSNLYIIGTMNTADRSVEALDTALRRRFSFKELMPDPAVVAQKGFVDYPRVTIMEQINNRIELLLDKNHTLGHAYFIKDDFEHSFKNEIIPLLQEYFYNDCGKLGLILGKGFVRAKELTSTSNQHIFADFETKNEIDIVKSYELIPFKEVDFKTALDTLLA